jgi:hypothetical protein
MLLFFKHTGMFVLNQEHIIGKTIEILNVLHISCKKLNLIRLLIYASQIWGNNKSKWIERDHLKFC